MGRSFLSNLHGAWGFPSVAGYATTTYSIAVCVQNKRNVLVIDFSHFFHFLLCLIHIELSHQLFWSKWLFGYIQVTNI